MNVIISQPRRYLTKGNADGGFGEKVLIQLCHQYPHYNFFDLSYDKSKSAAALPANAKTIVISTPFTIKKLALWWYGRKIKKLAKQLNIDIVVHIYDYIFIPLVKEWLLIKQLPDNKSEHLHSLTGIITPSLSVKNMLLKENIELSRIKNMYCFPDDSYKSVDWDTRENSKQRFAEGREYLLFDAVNASQTLFLSTIKGFSTIKKWLKTNMKLIIINAPVNTNSEDLFNTYKYKADVKVIKNSENFIYYDVLAAAFAFIYMPRSSENELPLLQSFQCGVPTITYHIDYFHEICNDGVMYVDPNEEEDIGEKLMKLCKDEKTRIQLVQKGTARLNALKRNNDTAIFEQ